MSTQQPLWKRPSGPKPRAYKWAGRWAADIRPGEADSYQVSFHDSQAEAFQQAVQYALGADQ